MSPESQSKYTCELTGYDRYIPLDKWVVKRPYQTQTIPPLRCAVESVSIRLASLSHFFVVFYCTYPLLWKEYTSNCPMHYPVCLAPRCKSIRKPHRIYTGRSLAKITRLWSPKKRYLYLRVCLLHHYKLILRWYLS